MDAESAAPYRRTDSATFVVAVAGLPADQCSIRQLYPLLVRTLSNLLIAIELEQPTRAHLVTPERAHVSLSGERIAEEIRQRINTFANARTVTDNIFDRDLEPGLWQGDAHTESIAWAGRRLAELDLLPAAIRFEDVMAAEDVRLARQLYGTGGLSAGNFSERLDAKRFWMSASGIDKSSMSSVGRDFLLVKDYDAVANAMRVSVPPGVEPRRASVDTIAHWLIYRELPPVGAVLHVHAWLPDVAVTADELPCGTYDVGVAITELLRVQPDPLHAAVGQKNHGLTITGDSMREILERIGPHLTPDIPMS